MKQIYFVRHGESECNIKNIWQGEKEPLSEEGIRQAKILAERFLHIQVDIVLASADERARQTATIVHEVIQKPIEFRNDLVEMRKPSEMHGRPMLDEKAQEIQKLLIEHNHDPDWHYSDEENFLDRKTRVARVANILLERQEQIFLVVTHATFIRTMLLYMLLGDDLTSQNYYQFLRFFHVFNTGISLCRYLDDESRWQLVHWNDIAHLGQ